VRRVSLPLKGVVRVLHSQAVEHIAVVLVEADCVIRCSADRASGRVGASSKPHVERLLLHEERSGDHLLDRVAMEPVGAGRRLYVTASVVLGGLAILTISIDWLMTLTLAEKVELVCVDGKPSGRRCWAAEL